MISTISIWYALWQNSRKLWTVNHSMNDIWCDGKSYQNPNKTKPLNNMNQVQDRFYLFFSYFDVFSVSLNAHTHTQFDSIKIQIHPKIIYGSIFQKNHIWMRRCIQIFRLQKNPKQEYSIGKRACVWISFDHFDRKMIELYQWNGTERIDLYLNLSWLNGIYADRKWNKKKHTTTK